MELGDPKRLIRASWRRDFPGIGPGLLRAGGISVQRSPLWLGRHAHPTYEMHWLASGTLEVDLADGRRLRAHGGDLMLTRPGVGHRGVNDIIPPSRLLWLQLDTGAEPEPGLGLDDSERAVLGAALAQAGDGVRPAPGLRPHFNRIHAWLRRPGARAELRAELVLLLLAVQRILGGTAAPVPGPATVRALAWISAHPTAPLRVEALAARCGLSSSRFHAVFLAETGETPAACQRRLRLTLAGDLLRADPQRPVAAIARAVGFAGQRAFATAFRRQTGVTPSAWRELPTPAFDAPVVHRLPI
jgi:AraC-like DNA-binding protein